MILMCEGTKGTVKESDENGNGRGKTGPPRTSDMRRCTRGASEDITKIRFVPIQEEQESPILLISCGIQPDRPLPNTTTGTEPKKGVKEEKEKGKKEEEKKKRKEKKKEEEEEDGEKGEEERINYGASRVSKMATRGIRNRSTPYSSSSASRSRRSVGVQTSFSNGSRSTSTATFRNQVFGGTPIIYNVCSCKDHTCSKDKK